jgi:hypothetical protein
MNAHETSENRELTVCELDQVSGGQRSIEEVLAGHGVVGLILLLAPHGTLNAGLQPYPRS